MGRGRGPVRERGRRRASARVPSPRVLVALLSAQPDHGGRRPRASCSGWSSSPASANLLVVHDFAYADIAFDGHVPPSILQGRRRGRGRRRALHADEVVLDGGLAGGLRASATRRWCRRSRRLKSYLDYGTFQPIQIASIVAMNEVPDYPARDLRGLPVRGGTRSATGSPASAGRCRSRRGRCSSGRPIPEPYRALGSLEFALHAGPRGARRGQPRDRVRPRAATATSASLSSRTSTASGRRSRVSGAPCTSSRTVPAPRSRSSLARVRGDIERFRGATRVRSCGPRPRPGRERRRP